MLVLFKFLALDAVSMIKELRLAVCWHGQKSSKLKKEFQRTGWVTLSWISRLLSWVPAGTIALWYPVLLLQIHSKAKKVTQS